MSKQSRKFEQQSTKQSATHCKNKRTHCSNYNSSDTTFCSQRFRKSMQFTNKPIEPTIGRRSTVSSTTLTVWKTAFLMSRQRSTIWNSNSTTPNPNNKCHSNTTTTFKSVSKLPKLPKQFANYSTRSPTTYQRKLITLSFEWSSSTVY